MVQKSTSPGNVLVVIGAGVLVGITAMVLQLVLEPQSHVKQLFVWLNWPVDYTIDQYAHAFHNGNTDQLIPQGMALWGIYWLTLGSVAALGSRRVWRYFAIRNVKHRPKN